MRGDGMSMMRLPFPLNPHRPHVAGVDGAGDQTEECEEAV